MCMTKNNDPIHRRWRRVKEEHNESLDHKNGVVRRSSHEIVRVMNFLSKNFYIRLEKKMI